MQDLRTPTWIEFSLVLTKKTSSTVSWTECIYLHLSFFFMTKFSWQIDMSLRSIFRVTPQLKMQLKTLLFAKEIIILWTICSPEHLLAGRNRFFRVYCVPYLVLFHILLCSLSCCVPYLGYYYSECVLTILTLFNYSFHKSGIKCCLTNIEIFWTKTFNKEKQQGLM